MLLDRRIKVYIEISDERVSYRHATCWLSEYKWEDIYDYFHEDIAKFQEIMKFSQKEGLDNASSL